MFVFLYFWTSLLPFFRFQKLWRAGPREISFKLIHWVGPACSLCSAPSDDAGNSGVRSSLSGSQEQWCMVSLPTGFRQEVKYFDSCLIYLTQFYCHDCVCLFSHGYSYKQCLVLKDFISQCAEAMSLKPMKAKRWITCFIIYSLNHIIHC